MIKFFRNIRKTLLEKGKTTSYLKYAFGEIVLVVVGILIALSINTWNENRKDRSFEVKMLKEVKTALISDKAHFETMKERMMILKDRVDFFVNYIADQKTMNDSLNDKIFGLNMGISTQFNNGAYSAIKASGIDKISNDSLRNSLIYFYDFEFPNFISRLEHYNRSSDRDIDAVVSLQNDPEIDTLNHKVRIFQNFPHDVLERPQFLKVLRSISFRSTRTKSTIDEILPSMQNMINKINKEIQK